jgi:hypothetical protein
MLVTLGATANVFFVLTIYAYAPCAALHHGTYRAVRRGRIWIYETVRWRVMRVTVRSIRLLFDTSFDMGLAPAPVTVPGLFLQIQKGSGT